jgi:enoyl-CoA hydratase
MEGDALMETVRVEFDAGIATLYLDRPPVNAVENELLSLADTTLARLQEQADLRGLVVTGAGRCFSAGLDLKIVPHYSAAEQQRTMESINRVVARLYGLPLPAVAAINGHAIAGGLVLALACDYRVGTMAACQIGLTEARAGIPFPAVAMNAVRAEVAPAVARRLTLMGRNYGPQAALADGILDELQPAEQVLRRAREIAADLGSIPRDAYVRIKHQLRAETIAANHLVVGGKDPLADGWMSREAARASAALLATKAAT